MKRVRSSYEPRLQLPGTVIGNTAEFESVVFSSNLNPATRKYWPVAQLDQMYPAFNRGVVSSNLTGPTSFGHRLIGKAPGGDMSSDLIDHFDRVNSSMAEQCPVKAKVENSNLSSSAEVCDEYNSVMRSKRSASIRYKQPGALAEWI